MLKKQLRAQHAITADTQIECSNQASEVYPTMFETPPVSLQLTKGQHTNHRISSSAMPGWQLVFSRTHCSERPPPLAQCATASCCPANPTVSCAAARPTMRCASLPACTAPRIWPKTPAFYMCPTVQVCRRYRLHGTDRCRPVCS